MPLSHDHKCLFIHIPRTGGTSFRKILGIDREDENGIPAYLENINGKGLLSVCNRNPELPSNKVPRVLHKEHLCMKHIHQLSLVDNKIYSEYFKFAFVRNPWDRALSIYSNHYYIYCNDFQEFVNKIKVIASFINDNFTFELEEKFYEDYSRVVFNTLYNKDTDFPHKPWDGDDVIFDPQFIPQYLFTHNEYGDKLVDTIGRFENFAEDAAKILELLEIDQGIEKIHASEHLPYKAVYTAEMADIIADAYAKDIEIFNYKF